MHPKSTCSPGGSLAQPRNRQTIPAPLFIGLVAAVCGTVVLTAAIINDRSVDRWELFYQGCGFASVVLVTSGLFGLASRLVGIARVTLQIAAWIFAVNAAWILARMAITAWLADTESLVDFWMWSWRVSGASGFVATILVVVSSRAWVRHPVAAIFAVVASLAHGWTPYIGEKIFELWENHRTLYNLYWPLHDIVWTLCMLGMLHKLAQTASPEAPDPRAAAIALRRAAGVLWFRIVAAIGVAIIAAVPAITANETKLVVLAGPAIVVLTMVACGWELLAIERARHADIPRIRVTVGAAMLLAWAAMYAQKIAMSYAPSVNADSWRSDGATTSWTILGPIIGFVGLGLVGSALMSYATARGDLRLRESATVRLILFVVLSSVTIAVLGMLELSGDRKTAAIGLVAALSSVGALISLAGLFSKTASVIETEPGLPPARVV